jgi:hypothetical protein
MAAEPMKTKLSNTVTLLAIVAGALALRFAGNSFGLRHTPFVDERFFVENVQGMLDRGDLDHRFHMYPGFFFYILMPALAFVPRPFDADAYLLARQVVGVFSVGSVLLAFLLGRRLGSGRVGLLAAAILAVSPAEVFVAHEVRPDVVLAFFALLTLLVIDRLDSGWRRNALCGVAVGMTTAIKFTGVAVAAAFVARRLTIPGARWRGLALAGAVSLLTFAALSPYSFLHFRDFLAGVALQHDYHTALRSRGPQPHWLIAVTYVRSVLPRALGWPAVLLALVGLWSRRGEWRRILPLAALPVTLTLLLSTAQIQRWRYVLSGLGALAVLAALGLDSLWRRSRILGAGLALIALGVPFAATLDDVVALCRPSTADRALDWIQANAPPGARILTSVEGIGLDPARFEVLPFETWAPHVQRIAARADFLVTTDPITRGYVARFVAEPAHPRAGPTIWVSSSVVPRHSTVLDGRSLRLDASENAALLPRLVDRDPETAWETVGAQKPGSWIEVRFPNPQTVDRVELALGARPWRRGRDLRVTATEDGQSWRSVEIVDGRPPVLKQVGQASQVLVFVNPARIAALRITQWGRRERRWGVAELYVEVLPDTARVSPEP